MTTPKTRTTESGKKLLKQEAFPKLQTLIDSLGEWNINILALSKEWKIPKSNLYRWKEQIVKAKPPMQIDALGRNIQDGMIANLKRIQADIVTSQNIKERSMAIRIFNDTVKTLTDFLEAYGYKDKIADRFHHEGDIKPAMTWEDFSKAIEQAQLEEKA